MKYKKRLIIAGILFLLVLFIRLFSISKFNTEYYYSTGIYPYISSFFRTITGWIPFSLGDVLYGSVAVWLVIKLCKAIRAIILKKITWIYFVKKSFSGFIKLFVIYIVFNILWGINYNRQGIAAQLDLKIEQYTTEDLKIITTILLEKVNENKAVILKNGAVLKTNTEMFQHSAAAYSVADNKFAFLQYQTSSVKSSLWSFIGNYIGFAGYYNPFTGEAQVNTSGPRFLLPFVTCHEIAHQLGYAKENEANFVGYLAASSSKDSLLLYSTYLDMFVYADRNLASVDSVAAMSFAQQLLPAVRADLKEMRDFNLSHKNPVEPIIRWVYGKYLQSNQQPNGNLSYDEVTGLLIAYYKKNGTL